ncbi:unknown [Clostridium sp. CAG:609]|nr:unknown [Clostridium sp. CAG:609]
MKKSTKIMIISLVSVIFVLLLVLGITKAFMKPIEQGGNITEVSLNSCAKIKLTSTSNVNLSSSYPMSRNKGLQTTPYKFTVTSYCDSYVGFNLYVATLSTNTIDAKYVRYILTQTGTKNVIQEGILSSATNGVSDFTDTEITELNTGLKGTYGSIYKIHSENIPLKGSKSFDIYLFLDGDVADNSTMGKTFKAGVAVKSYEREKDILLADYVKSLYTGTQGENGIYYHDANLTNGAGDNSYRYAGASDAVNNYVCFGSTQSPCPADNLYRIIGVFGDRVKLIKSDYATTALLGTDGDYSKMYTANNWDNSSYKGNNLANIAAYNWNKSNQNTWSLSNLNKTNLNTNFITNIGADWAAKIAETTWKVGGNTYAKIRDAVPSVAYQNEIVNPVTTNSQDNKTEYSAKIGLMYASDYGFAAAPSSWTTNLYSYDGTAIKSVNWMYMGLYEWTISRDADDSSNAFNVNNTGYVDSNNVGNDAYGVRPVFNLSSSVNYASGSGTAADPILVS